MKKQTVEQMYQEFLTMLHVSEDLMHPEQRIQLRQAFFGGVGSILLYFRDVVGAMESEEEGTDELAKLSEEVSEYWDTETKVDSVRKFLNAKKMRHIIFLSHIVGGIVWSLFCVKAAVDGLVYMPTLITAWIVILVVIILSCYRALKQRQFLDFLPTNEQVAARYKWPEVTHRKRRSFPEIFDASAKNHMVNWNSTEFGKTHPSLYAAILFAMAEAERQGIESTK